MSHRETDDNGLPIPPTPEAIETMPDPRDKQRALELWRAANRLLAVTYHWEAWWNDFYDTDDVDPSLPLHWLMIAHDCLRAIFLHGAGGHVVPGDSFEDAMGRLFRVPDGGLRCPKYDLGERGECVVVGEEPPWQDRLREWAALELQDTRNKVNRLITGVRGLLALLQKFPAATLTPPPPPSPAKPCWDSGERKLWFKGRLCRKFTKAAPYQQTILQSFEELGWPQRIDDPL